jgi:hypothetical protein
LNVIKSQKPPKRLATVLRMTPRLYLKKGGRHALTKTADEGVDDKAYVRGPALLRKMGNGEGAKPSPHLEDSQTW